MHCTAAPAVPLARLSTAPTTTARPCRPGGGVDGDLEVDGVRAEHGLGLGPAALGQQVHERLVGVGRFVGAAQGRGRRTGGDGGRAGREDAAAGRHQDRGEADADLGVGQGAEVLDDLGGVAVDAADAVGADVAHDLAAEQVRLQGLAGAGGAAGGDHDHVGGVDEPGGDGRGEGEGGDGRVAAGDGHAPRAGEDGALVAELGQAVGPGAGVLAAVELLPDVGVGEAEVGAAVDHHGVLAQLGGQGGGLPVRQGQEDDVVAGEGGGVGGAQHAVGQRQQVGLEGAERGAGVGAGGQRADLHLGVGQQQAQELSPGVPARAGDGDPDRHAHDYTEILELHASRGRGTPLAPRRRGNGVAPSPHAMTGSRA